VNEHIQINVSSEIFDACLSHREGLPKPVVHHAKSKHRRICLVANVDQAIDIAVFLREFATRADTAVAWRTLDSVELGIKCAVL
jgi:hypothetical protein